MGYLYDIRPNRSPTNGRKLLVKPLRERKTGKVGIALVLYDQEKPANLLGSIIIDRAEFAKGILPVIEAARQMAQEPYEVPEGLLVNELVVELGLEN